MTRLYPRSVTQRSWKRREGVVRRSWWSCASRGSVTQVVGASYDGRAAVPSISREGVTQKSCRVTATQSIIKVTEQSACFGHGGITAFTERRVTWGISLYSTSLVVLCSNDRLPGKNCYQAICGIKRSAIIFPIQWGKVLFDPLWGNFFIS